MAKGSAKSLAAIQRLVAERVQIEQWLERLDLAGDKTPDAVRAKIRSDYQTRLQEVIKELVAYGDELSEALKRQQATRDGLTRQEKEAAERLAEAEVRHAVGEYDEAKWRNVHAEYLSTLVKLREELKNAEEEITRLEEVVGNLKATPAPASSPPAEAPEEPPAAALPKAPAKAKAAPVDELAFLKSVTEDEKHGPSPARASGTTHRMVEPQVAKPAPSPPPPPAPPPEPPKPKVDVGAGGVSAIDSSGPGKRLTGMLEKTLKCKECGTLNMPTEWYCEKCGAEITQI